MKRKKVIIDIGIGDQGKGTSVDYIARTLNAHTVFRYNGGPQCGHNVVTSDGSHHCFAQLGSASFVPWIQTYLGKFMVVDPLSLEVEIDEFEAAGYPKVAHRLMIDGECLMVTPLHIYHNRMLELSRNDRHGSCGKGVWRTVVDGQKLKKRAPRIQDLLNLPALRSKLHTLLQLKKAELSKIAKEHENNVDIQGYYNQIVEDEFLDALMEMYEAFAQRFSSCIVTDEHVLTDLLKEGVCIFEGGQGVLLDHVRGFHPHVTGTDTTGETAFLMMDDVPRDDIEVLGILRGYGMRHGAGPFITEDAQVSQIIPQCHNGTNEWQGPVRLGWFDVVATRYALEVAGCIDTLTITNLDRMSGIETISVCTAYEFVGEASDAVLDIHFEWHKEDDKRIITRLRVPEEDPSEEHQEQLTKLLFMCQPIYQEVPGFTCEKGTNTLNAETNAYIELLSELLDVPVSFVSVGPTADDKIEM